MFHLVKKKIVWANLQSIIEHSPFFSKLRVWVPGSEIFDPEKTYSGSRCQKGTGSRIRIRNTENENLYKNKTKGYQILL
jgi:hypothetical protein